MMLSPRTSCPVVRTEANSTFANALQAPVKRKIHRFAVDLFSAVFFFVFGLI